MAETAIHHTYYVKTCIIVYAPLSQISVCRTDKKLHLARCHRLFRTSEELRMTCLDFHKDHLILITCDKVYLLMPATPVTLQYSIAFSYEIVCSQIFTLTTKNVVLCHFLHVY